MRTTITIDDELYREVKESAARTGRTVAAVFEDAVRRGLSLCEARADSDHYRIQPIGRGGLRPGVDLSSNAALAETMTDDGDGDALR